MKLWWKRFVAFIRGFYYREYVLSVWFSDEDIYDSQGNLIVSRRSRKDFTLTSIDKLTPKHIIAQEKGSGRLVIKTQKPFDYNLRRVQ